MVLLPAPDGPTIATFSPGAHLERDAVQRRCFRPRRIGEMNVVERDLAAALRRQGDRSRRRLDRGLGLHDLEQPLRRARGRGDLAPHLAQLAKPAGREHRIEHELRQPSRGHPAGQHVLRADPQHHHDAGEHQKDGDRGEQRAGERRVLRGAVGALHRVGEACDGRSLVGVGLQRAHRADLLGGEGRGVGERVLRHPRAAAHGAAEADQRQHDQRNGAEHERRQLRARHHHHDRCADEQHQVAQRDRYRGADRGLDLGGVGGQPRQQLAALRSVEERGRQRGEMAEHLGAQVGDDALAERGDEVVAHGAGDGEHRRHRDHHREIAVDQLDAFRREAEVDHAPHRDRHDQRRERRDHQRDEGGNDAAAIAQHIGQELLERLDLDAAAARRVGRGLRARRQLQAATSAAGRVVHGLLPCSAGEGRAATVPWRSRVAM